MRERAVGISVLILLSVVLQPLAQTVTGVTVSGNTVKVSLGTNVCEFTPISDWVVKAEFKPNGQTYKASEIIDSALSSTLSFSGVQQNADPLVLTGGQYVVSIAKNPFSIEFSDKNGTQLFKSSAVTATELSGQVVSGNYYGFRNDATGATMLVKSDIIDPSYQGRGCSPFIWTTKNFGVLVDAEKGSFNLTGTALKVLRTGAMNRNTLFFLMTGSPRQIMQNYYRVTGFHSVPHLWTLGYMNSEWDLNETEMMTQNRRYREKDIPMDARILDYDWYNHNTPDNGDFRWNATKFPSAMSGALKKTCDSMGIRMVGIRKPFGYFGSKDFYTPADQTWYWQRFVDPAYDSYARGIIGFWCDEADWQRPPFNGLYMAKAMHHGQRSYNNTRVWTINRNYMGGAHRYAYALWSGDIQTSFAEMAAQRGFMLSSINIGAAWWSMDICGFWGGGYPALYTRWMQFGAFVPIYRTHGYQGKQRQPWNYGPDADSLSSKFIRLRYTLIPYLYSAYWKLHLDGVPIVRPLVMDYPTDPAVANRQDCYMFGEAFHVTPVVTGPAETADPALFTPVSVRTYLPAGKWVNFWTDEVVDGGRELTLTVPKNIIPVYVKQGSVIARRPHGRWTEDPLVKEVNFHVYAGANGSFDYFEDDFWTYDYQKGTYFRQRYAHESGTGQEKITITPVTTGFTPAPKTGYFTFHCIAEKPVAVFSQKGEISSRFVASGIEAAAAPAWTWDAGKKLAIVKVEDPYAPGTVVVSATPVRVATNTRSARPLRAVSAKRTRDGVLVRLPGDLTAAVRVDLFNVQGKRLASATLDPAVSGDRQALISTKLAPSATCVVRVFAGSSELTSGSLLVR